MADCPELRPQPACNAIGSSRASLAALEAAEVKLALTGASEAVPRTAPPSCTTVGSFESLASGVGEGAGSLSGSGDTCSAIV